LVDAPKLHWNRGAQPRLVYFVNTSDRPGVVHNSTHSNKDSSSMRKEMRRSCSGLWCFLLWGWSWFLLKVVFGVGQKQQSPLGFATGAGFVLFFGWFRSSQTCAALPLVQQQQIQGQLVLFRKVIIGLMVRIEIGKSNSFS